MVNLTIKIPKTIIMPFKVDSIRIGEKRMWPGKKAKKEEGVGLWFFLRN